jgi:BASS family bile acid:Na+ symporter
MFGMGLSLRIRDFQRVLVRPKALLIGLCCQMILLPSLAFLIATLAQLPPEIKVGIIIIAACPGGATSNLITYLLRGNVALSISMTSVNSFLTLFSVPFLIFWGLVFFMGEGVAIHMPVWSTVRNIFIITIIPTSLGVLIRYRWRDIAIRMEKPGRYVLTILYAIIFVVAVLVSSHDSTREVSNLYWQVAPFTLLLNLLGMITGFAFAKIMGYRPETQITLAVEIGIQNSALAITIASSAMFLHNPVMAIPAIVYGVFTFASAIIFGMMIKRGAENNS